MSDFGSLYIERNNCGDCYKCVRECVVKALRFHRDEAGIERSMCIGCGTCVGVCPSEVIKIRDDVWTVRKMFGEGAPVVASLSPTWITEFPGVSSQRMVEALRLLGFARVSESSLGAEKTLESELEILRRRKGLSISSRCPAVTRYICKYKPALAENILPVESPMTVHGRMIRQWWGSDVRIVHLSPCIAAKQDVGAADGVDAVLTFRELKTWLHNENIEFGRITGAAGYRFEPVTPRTGVLDGVLRGGVNAGLLRREGLGHYTYIGKSSVGEIERLLKGITEPVREDVYLDLMACDDGCIGSCGSTQTRGSLIGKQIELHTALEERLISVEPYELPDVETLRADYTGDESGNRFVAESDIVETLKSLGFEDESRLLNCGGCGYASCRRFAKALYLSLAERRMCTYFIRKELQDKFTLLLNKIPQGVLIVGREMNVLDVNRSMAAMLGPEAEHLFDTGVFRGQEAAKALPFSDWVESVLRSGEEYRSKDMQVNGRLLNVGVYTVQKHRLLLVLARNMVFTQVRNEEIVTRTQTVIRDNLDTVRKIASLLGENASRTEAVLNSILESQTNEDAGDQ